VRGVVVEVFSRSVMVMVRNMPAVHHHFHRNIKAE
jgi:hypothetical protein